MSGQQRDCVIVGGGTAGLAAAIFAAGRGLDVVLIERLDRVGGTLHMATGQMSAAGTSLQAERGIEDHPDLHYEDVMRITRGTANAAMVRKAVDIAAETIEWLRGLDFEFHPDCPAIIYNHEPYSRPRTYWGMEKGLSIVKVIQPVLERLVAQRRLELRLGTGLEALLSDGARRVAGVLTQSPDGARHELHAANVVLTTGGYAGNPALFRRLSGGHPLYGPMFPTATGAGIEAAVRLGADTWCGEHFLPSVGGFEEEPGSHRVSWTDRPNLTPQWRQPWEILVDRRGRRFMAEDEQSIDRREHAVLGLDDLTFWIVFDAGVMAAAPALFPQWEQGRMAAMFGRHHAFVSADSIEALAAATGIDARGLAATVAAYNAAVASGDDALGRKHLPLPIARAPFFAIRNHGVSIKGAAGLRIDPDFRVLGDDGRPFENLFAAGELSGGGLLSGHAYVGGMSITPALGFGREIGRAVGHGAGHGVRHGAGHGVAGVVDAKTGLEAQPASDHAPAGAAAGAREAAP